jgi:8-oxo-dGTP pyrophosphatase MutT (NUDIX family)
MNQSNPFKTHSSKVVYENHWMKVHEDQITHPAGHDGIYAYVEVKNSVVIVAINDKNEIFLARNFRYPIKEWGWGLPGGGGEKDEEIIKTSRRELVEEAGLASDDWRMLGETLVWNGLATERQISLLARNVYQTKRVKSDDEKLISDGQFFALSKIREMIARGEINDNQTIAALYLAELFLREKEAK